MKGDTHHLFWQGNTYVAECEPGRPSSLEGNCSMLINQMAQGAWLLLFFEVTEPCVNSSALTSGAQRTELDPEGLPGLMSNWIMETVI